MKGNLILLATAIVLSLYATELMLYFRDLRFVAGLPASIVEVRCPGPAQADPRCMQAAREGVPFDPRPALEVFRESAEQGDTVWPAVHATLFEPGDGLAISDSTQGTRTTVPLAGISDTETLLCNESGTWVFYRADEHGLNNPPGVHGRDSVTLAVVGDSFVHGWCVPRAASVAGLLQRRHGPVLNLGLEGSGPLAQLGLLREYGQPLRPALVLWLFFAENDLGDLAREMETPILAGYLDPEYTQGLRSVQPQIDEGLKVAVQQRREVEENQLRQRAERLRGDRLGRDNQLLAWAKLRRLRRLVQSLEDRPRGPDDPWDAESFRTVMAHARDEVESWGGQMVFVYLPSWQRVMEPEYANPHRMALLDEVARLGLPTIDATPEFTAHSNPEELFPFGLAGHYSEAGYRLLVSAIEDGLGELGSN